MASGDSGFAKAAGPGAVTKSPFVDDETAAANPASTVSTVGRTQLSPFLSEPEPAADADATELKQSQIEAIVGLGLGFSEDEATKVVEFLHGGEADAARLAEAFEKRADDAGADLAYVVRAVLGHLADDITEVTEPGNLTEVEPNAGVTEDTEPDKQEPVADEAPKLHPDVAEAFTTAGASEGELSKIHGLIVQEVEGIEGRIVAALEAGEEGVKSELEKLREEFGLSNDEPAEQSAPGGVADEAPAADADATVTSETPASE